MIRLWDHISFDLSVTQFIREVAYKDLTEGQSLAIIKTKPFP
jgi:hypothetical protein